MKSLFRKSLLAIGLFLIIIAVVFLWRVLTIGPEDFEDYFSKIKIGNTTFIVEVADTLAVRAKGLSGREQLEEGRGMLFIFDAPGQYSFWMKDMKFPIDIIWITDDEVVGMTLGAEPETGEPLTIYTPPQQVDEVLEINAGAAMKLGINIGDRITY